MEIERRFLLQSEDGIKELLPTLSCKYIRQGYIYVDRENRSCTRVRIIGDEAFLTLKKQVSTRSVYEFEYPIPHIDALHMLDVMRQGYIIEKKRYYYTSSQGMCFEIDIFMGENTGLYIVEVELPYEDFLIELPSWIGQEITGEARYTNALLAQNPFSLWSDQ